MPVLKLGDFGIDVIKVQLLLNYNLQPCPFLAPTGFFDDRTQAAVRAFQKAQRLAVDGTIGPNTLTALGLKPASAASPAQPKSFGVSWFDIAWAEKGVAEDSRPGKHNARIVEYHRTTTLKASDDETPWCSSFVNWVMIQAGRKGTNNAAARSWLDWGLPVTNPERGTIVVIRKKNQKTNPVTGFLSGYHVGFYVSSTASHIKILGGNQSNTVKETEFPLNSFEIVGYRKPK